MTLKYAILTLLFFASLCIHVTADDTASTFDMSDTITTIKSASDTLTGKKQNDIKTFLKNWQEPYDTTRDEGYWKRALVHRKFDINDKSVKYPSFIDFCIRVYRWGDYTFNHYDSTYVVGTGKNWKFMLKNDNRMDTYYGHLNDRKMPIGMNSPMRCSFGVQVAFMAVSLGYMLNLNYLLTGEKVKTKTWEYSFTCSRILMDTYYSKSTNDVTLNRLGDYRSTSKYSHIFKGLKQENFGLYGYYIFNHTHYSQAAAYCFSKYQRRSSGSLIAGLNFSYQDIDMDFNELNKDMQGYLIDDKTDYRFRYTDYNFLFGYGYSWVFKPRWLFNVTVTPGIGYRHSYSNSIEGSQSMLSTNYRIRLALVHNRGNYFYGLHAISAGSWYRSNEHSFFHSQHNVSVTAGYRF